jgi:hypothetical protein
MSAHSIKAGQWWRSNENNKPYLVLSVDKDGVVASQQWKDDGLHDTAQSWMSPVEYFLPKFNQIPSK